MPKLINYNANAPIAGPVNVQRLSGADIGGGQGLIQAGQLATEVGTSMAAAEKRKSDRADTIQRTRATNSFKTAMQEEFTARSTEEDFTDPEVLTQFGADMRNRADEIIGEHGGSADSRAMLALNIEEARGGIARSAAKHSTDAQNKLIEVELASFQNEVANKAAGSPGSINDFLVEASNKIDDLSPALSPQQERDARDVAASNIITQSVQSFVTDGDTEAARKALEHPAAAAMDPDTSRQLRTQIVGQERIKEKGAIAGEQAVEKAQVILGRSLTSAERLKLSGVAPSATTQTPAQKISGMEAALNRPLTPTEQTKAMGIFIAEDDGNVFGKSLTGRSLDIMTQNAPAFSAGTLTPEAEREFQAALVAYTTPTQFINERGLPEQRIPPLPQFVKEALAARGQEVPGSSREGPLDVGEDGLTPVDPNKTVWNLAEDTTGPIPAISETLGRIPVIGEAIDTSAATQARNFVPIIGRELTRVLQNNPKYAEGERKGIEAEININPSVFDNPTAYRDRLVAVDDALAVRQNTAFKTASNPLTSKAERLHSMNVLNGLMKFRESLGVPPLVQTPEEAKKLPPGTQFRTPDGKVRQVPDEAQ
ncbi:MAG: hypothetical protein V7745_07555 [Pseudomonadales bacterium]